jgi:hypothetical protein
LHPARIKVAYTLTGFIVIQRCRFENAGNRSVNIGGSTGLEFFRPKADGYEAKDIAAKLKKHGITATYVSNVKGKMDLNAEMQSGATASTGNTVGRPATATNSLDAAIKFIEQSGGLKAAKAAIEKIERIKSL